MTHNDFLALKLRVIVIIKNIFVIFVHVDGLIFYFLKLWGQSVLCDCFVVLLVDRLEGCLFYPMLERLKVIVDFV